MHSSSHPPASQLPNPAPQPDKSPPASHGSRPLQAAVLLSVLYLLARFIGLVQSAIIAGKLEPFATDAYNAAFSLPDFINQLIAGGAMSVTFIPIFTQLLHTGKEKEAWRFFSTLATIMGSVLVVITLLSLLYTEQLIHIFAPGLTNPARDPRTYELTVAMTRVLLPAQFFFYIGGMIVGVLNAHKRFGVSGWTGAVYNLVAIIVALALLNFVGPIAFAWGILIGAISGNFLMPLLAARGGQQRQRLRFRLNFNWRQPALRRFFINALPIMIGVSFPVVDQLVITRFASFLPEGPLTHLRNGNRLMLAPLSIVAQAASVAAFPFLAADTAAQDWKRFTSFLRSGLRRLIFLTLPLSTLLILLARPLSTLIFRHGNYTQAAADETAVAFAFYCVGLFAWAGQQFVARGFYALQDTRTPTIIGSILTVFFVIGLWWAARSSNPVLALSMATSIGAAAHFCGVLLALERKLSRRRYNAPIRLQRISGTLARTLAACLLMGLAGVAADRAAAGFLADDKIGDMMRMMWVSLVAGLVFAGAAQAFSIPEWHWLRSKLLRRFKR